VNKHIPAPAVPYRFADVPFPFRQPGYFVKKYAMMEPWYLCSNLLHKSGVTPGFGKFPHIFQVPDREPFHVGEFVDQI
jgi:hypothetical protein